jgi:hypothetical protein
MFYPIPPILKVPMDRHLFHIFFLLCPVLLAAQVGPAPDDPALAISQEDLIFEEQADGGFHLYIRKKPGIGSVLLTESTRDPALRQDSYAYRAAEWNPINGDEIRVIDDPPSRERIYSLIDSTPEAHPAFGQAFHIFIPYILLYGYESTRHGEVYVVNGTYFNARAFTLPYADYRGPFRDNPFVLEVIQRPLPDPPPRPPEIPPAPNPPPVPDPPSVPDPPLLPDPLPAPAPLAVPGPPPSPDPPSPPPDPPPPDPPPLIASAPLPAPSTPPSLSQGNYMKETVAAFSEIGKDGITYSKGPEDLVDKIREALLPERGKALDLVLCLDTTNSMRKHINAVRKALIPMLKELLAGFPSFRIGMVLYRDYSDAYLNRKVAFTSDFTRFQTRLNGIDVDGGGDIPEAVYEALHEGAVGFPWNAESRMMILIGDAPPHLRQRGKISKEMSFEAAKERNIKVYAIILPQ